MSKSTSTSTPTFPKTMFQPRTFARVQTVIVTRESATNWWIQTEENGREERLFKGGHDGHLCATFAEARTYGVARQTEAVARIEKDLARAKERLAEWKALDQAQPLNPAFVMPAKLEV